MTNPLWGWLQTKLKAPLPVAELPPVVAPMEPPAIKQEQFADRHQQVRREAQYTRGLASRICAINNANVVDEMGVDKDGNRVVVDKSYAVRRSLTAEQERDAKRLLDVDYVDHRA